MHKALAFAKGACLVTIFIAVMITAWLGIVWWDSTWRAAVEPTRASIYKARLATHCAPDWMLWSWRTKGCKLT
jgi:hypothetical protein